MGGLAGRFTALRKKHGNSPTYATEGVLIGVTEQLVKLLEARRMTRTDLARALGCSNAYVTKLLAGKQNLTLESLVRLAVSLNARLDMQLVPMGSTVSRRPSGNEPLKRITVDRRVLAGKPTIRGKRISVQQVLRLLEKGMTHAEILREFPTLEEEDIRAALRYASQVVSQERLLQFGKTG